MRERFEQFCVRQDLGLAMNRHRKVVVLLQLKKGGVAKVKGEGEAPPSDTLRRPSNRILPHRIASRSIV